MKKRYKFWLGIIVIFMFNGLAMSQQIPLTFKSIADLNQFLSKEPQFKCVDTGHILKLTYNGGKYVAYVNNKKLGSYEVDWNKEFPDRALIGLPWMRVYGQVVVINRRN